MRVEAQDVAVVVGGRTIFSDATVSCTPGTMTALVGPSGCGKTTLLHCLGLLQVPSTGSVVVDGVDTTGWRSRRRRRFWRDHSAFVLQDYGVMEEETVAYNVTMSRRLIGSTIAGDLDRCRHALDRTGLGGRADEAASHLSGGEKQRLSIARAMYKDAQVVLVDEPTASLDDRNRESMIGLFRDLADQGRVVVVATHDHAMMSACDAQFLLPGDRDRSLSVDVG